MDNFLLAVNAVVPFIIYMGIGMLLVKFRFTSREFLQKLNAMVFKAFFPFMMFRNFASIELSGDMQLGYTVFALTALFLVILLASFVIGKTNWVSQRNQKPVMIQALFRSNSILFALPLAQTVFGEEGVQAASILVAVLVPLYNVSAVVVLESYNGERSSLPGLLKKIITNPLIIGAIIGVIYLLLPFELPNVVMKPINAIADMTTPLALIILGGTLQFNSARKHIRQLTAVIVLKLIAIPAVILLVLKLFSFTPAQDFSIFAVFATPVAVSSYTMAANMGGDGDLAGEIVAFTTAASLFTIFLWTLSTAAGSSAGSPEAKTSFPGAVTGAGAWPELSVPLPQHFISQAA